MKYGLAELIEEKDIPDLYRKMIKEGAIWGCDWLNGFLESLNAKREQKDRFTVLVRNPGECDFCDFVFAIKNRICAVVFDVYSWDRHHLTYERRMRLIEASLEHRLMPIVVNLEGGWYLKPYMKPEDIPCGFEVAKSRWMVDPVSGVSVFPDMGLEDDEGLCYPLDEWAAELYAKNATRRALEQKGLQIVQMYPNNRFIWAKDCDGKPTWVLVSFHHAAMKDAPDYSGFDKNHPNVAGKAGYGVDVAISNAGDDSLLDSGAFKPVYRSCNIEAEVVAITKIADGVEEATRENDSADTMRPPSGDAPAAEENEDDLYDEYGIRKKKPAAKVENGGKLVEMSYGNNATRHADGENGQIEDPDENTAAIKAEIAAMSYEEKLVKAKAICEKRLAKNPDDEEAKIMLAKVTKAQLALMEKKKSSTGGQAPSGE